MPPAFRLKSTNSGGCSGIGVQQSVSLLKGFLKIQGLFADGIQEMFDSLAI